MTVTIIALKNTDAANIILEGCSPKDIAVILKIGTTEKLLKCYYEILE